MGYMPVDDVAKRKEEFYFEVSISLRPSREVWRISQPVIGGFPLPFSADAELGDRVFRNIEILDKFNTLVCAGEYQKSKPDPEAFLIAAHRLANAIESCLVFGDTSIGIGRDGRRHGVGESSALC